MDVQEKLGSVVLPGWEQLPDFGLYMDQLVTFAERCFAQVTEEGQHLLTPAMINNYVKCGLMDRPQGKKYDRGSLGQLLMICLLKQTTPIDTMKLLLHPADGTTAEELYRGFCTAQARIADSFDALSREADPLMCALEAASYQFLCRALLSEKSAAENAAPVVADMK